MSRKRVVIVSLIAGVAMGAGVAGGIAQASGSDGSGSSNSRGTGSVATFTVERTNLASTVQVGG